MDGTRRLSCRWIHKDKNLTFLALPPDLQKPTRRPNTNIASDKDRIATSRHPELDPKELRKILATPPPGAPGMNGPRAPQQRAAGDGAEPASCASSKDNSRRRVRSSRAIRRRSCRCPRVRIIHSASIGTGMSAGSAIQAGRGSSGCTAGRRRRSGRRLRPGHRSAWPAARAVLRF